MRVMWLLLCALLAAACTAERPRGPNSDVRAHLAPDNKNLGGGLMLFAATVVEGGGKRGTANDPPLVVIDVTHEFAAQWLPAGRMPLGKQTVVWAYADQWDFETPVNGTRIIAFAAESPGRAKVLPDQVFADTEANRKVASQGRAPQRAASEGTVNFQLVLFVASIAIAFAAVFLAWFRVRYGAIALGISVALWLGYEVTVPTQANIRIDLVILLPFMIAAIVSTLVAAADAAKESASKK